MQCMSDFEHSVKGRHFQIQVGKHTKIPQTGISIFLFYRSFIHFSTNNYILSFQVFLFLILCPLLCLSLSLKHTQSYSSGYLNLLPASVFEASLTERQMFMTSQQQHIRLLIILLFCSVMHMQLFFLSLSQAPNAHRPIETQTLL